MADDDLSETLADAVADEAAIDWPDAEEAARRTPDADFVRRLRIISAIGSTRRAEAQLRQARRPAAAVVGCVAVVGLAAAKVVLACLGTHAALTRVAPPPVAWPFAVNVLLFGIAGALLIVGGGRDRRVQSLGALFLVIASAFANPLMPRGGDGALELLGSWFRFLSADAFLAAALWLFVWDFPAEPASRGARRFAMVFMIGAAGLGLVLFTAHALRGLGVWSAAPSAIATMLETLDRMPSRAYWPLLFGMALPAVPYLLWKSRYQTVENRNRVALFVAVLVLGFSPMLVAVIVSPLLPWLTDPRWRDSIGYLLYAALALTVPGTVYAVAVDRLMDLHLVIRRTTQYALARYSVWGLCLGPLAVAAIDIYRHRDLTITGYFGVRAVALPALSFVGFLALVFRQRIMGVVDRWFLREPADYAEALARLERRFRSARSVREISGALQQELDRAVHPTRTGVLLVHEERGALVALDGATPPLGEESTLIDLFRSIRSEIQISSAADGPVARALPAQDRAWLADTGFHLFSPLVGSTGALIGVVGLGRSRNGLAYTARDYMVVTAMCGQAALKIENSSLSEPADRTGAPPRARGRAIDWQNEPAALCPACGAMWKPDLRVCDCGVTTVPAAMPLIVNGKFRVERLLGAGGIGVVYLAVDMTLDRKVAIKTLPSMQADHVARLHKEARAMAAVRHPNLALIYGAEHWRGTPLLIVEYLDSGTLLERLRQGPLDVEEAVDLGTALADALDRVHASGLLHRDVKPSNIGYTSDGLPKLLDFGLATILDCSTDGSAQPVRLDPGQVPELGWGEQPPASLTLTQQLVGTPLYLSPEALAGATPEPSFDLWSVSLVLYEALAGRNPFAGGSVAEVIRRIQLDTIPDVRDSRPDCPAAVAAFLNDALSRVPSRRPASAGELRTRLRWLRATMGSSHH